jgi:hypothetical protein
MSPKPPSMQAGRSCIRLPGQGLLPPTAVMLYAPRDEAELVVVERLVEASHRFARAV